MLNHDPGLWRSLVPALASLSILAVMTVTLLGPRSTLHRTFWLYMGALFLWSAASLFYPNPGAPGTLFWVRAQSLGITIAPALALHFSLVFTRRRWPALLVAGYALAALFAWLTLRGLVSTPLGFAGGRLYYRLGPAAPWLALYGAALGLLASGSLLGAARRTAPAGRQPYRLAALGMALSLAGGLLNFWPAVGGWPVDVAANAANALLLAHAMLRYGFLDLDGLLRRGITVMLFTVALASLYLTLWLLLDYHPALPVTERGFWLLLVLLAFLLGLGLEETRHSLLRLLDRPRAAPQGRREEALLEFARSLANSTSPIHITRQLVDTIAGTLPAFRAAVFLAGAERRALDLVAWSGRTWRPPGALAPTSPLVRCLEPGKQLHGSDPAFAARGAPVELPFSLAIGLFRQSRLLGVLVLQEAEAQAVLRREEEEWLVAMAGLLALAVENWLVNRQSQVSHLLDGLTGLPNHRYFQELLADRLDRFPGQETSLLLVDVDRFKLYNETFGPQAGDRALQQVARTLLSSVRAADVVARLGGSRFALLLPGCGEQPAATVAERCRAAVERLSLSSQQFRWPLTVSIGAASCPAHARRSEELLAAAEYALRTAKALGHNRVSTYTGREPAAETAGDNGPAGPGQANRGRAAEAYEESLLALAAAREAADACGTGHSLRVARYALALAEALRLSAEEKDILRTACLLRDLGMVGVPANLWHKDPQALTGAERELLDGHVQLGVAMIRNAPAFARCLSAIQAHHEWFDGSGYPQGLSGEAIPLVARILAIAEAYEAMAAGCYHRPPLSREEALQELKKGAGRQFDPRLVATFVQIMDAQQA